MTPQLSNERLEIVGADLKGALWVSEYLEVNSVTLRPVASGIDGDNMVKVRVSWGDGSQETSDFVPVGREYTFSHNFDSHGEYFIRAFVVNRKGETSLSSPLQTARLRVTLPTKKRVVLRRWGGLGLQTSSLTNATRIANEIQPVVSASLGLPAVKGSTRITLLGFIDLLPDSELTVFSPGKILSYARVVSSDETGVELDSPLNDSYSVGDAVEIRQRSYVSQLDKSTKPTRDWSFPPTYDIDLIKSSVVLNLGTRLGERLMRPSLGSAIEELVFSQNDPLLNQKLALATSDSLVVEPRASVQNITVTDSADHQKHLAVTLQLEGDDDAPFEATLPLSIFTV